MEYIHLIPLFPLIGFVINGLLAKRLGFSEKMVGAVACTAVGLSFVFSALAVSDFVKYKNDPKVQAEARAKEEALIAAAKGTKPAKEHAGGKAHDEKAAEGHGATESHSATAHKGGEHEVVATPFVKPVFEWIPGGVGRLTLGNNADKETSEFKVTWAYQLDQLSGLYILFITFVAFFIHLFAIGYMHGDPSFPRFFAYLNLFMFMMLNLVLGANFLIMFVGWEGVGLASYLLIGYYLKKQEAGDASKKAFVINRIGDFGLMLGVFGLFAVFGTFDYAPIMAMVKAYGVEPFGVFNLTTGVLTVITILLFIGATGKSAQIPLYTWLPDAMAGPTPVSALIHAATMVTAGVYMVARCNPLFQRAPTTMLVVAVIGCATAFVAATIGITQTDIKKALAYSTVSQLGYMFMGCGVGAFVAGVFHVVTHAFFKAQLFLGSGSVIHGGSPSGHQQEMTYYGNFKKYMPITFLTMMASLLAICGIIPFAGFFSKDEILAKTLHTEVLGHSTGMVLYGIGLLTAGVTAFYMTRLMCLTFFGKERFLDGPDFQEGGHHDDHHDDHHHAPASKDFHPHESPLVMTLPLMVLAVFAVGAGFLGVAEELTGGAIPNYVHHWLAPVIDSMGRPEKVVTKVDTGEWVLSIVSVVWALIMMSVAYYLYVIKPELPEKLSATLKPLYNLSFRKWYWDELLDVYFVRFGKLVNTVMWQIDQKLVDALVNLAAWLTNAGSFLFRTAQTGLAQNYALVMVLGLLILLAVMEWPTLREVLQGPSTIAVPPAGVSGS